MGLLMKSIREHEQAEGGKEAEKQCSNLNLDSGPTSEDYGLPAEITYQIQLMPSSQEEREPKRWEPSEPKEESNLF